MNKYWDDLTLTYDRKFETLETGRLAYAQAIAYTLNAIEQEITVRPGIEEAGFFLAGNEPAAGLRKTLEYGVKSEGGGGTFGVSMRFSAPWEGPPGFLQFVLMSHLNSKWTGSLRNLVRADEWAVRQSQTAGREIPNWIGSGSVELSDTNLILSASETLRDWIRLGYRVFATLRKEDLAYRMECILTECKIALKRDATIRRSFPDLLISEVEEWDPKGKLLRYVQINPALGRRGFWIGYEIYGHSLVFGIQPPDAPVEQFQAKLDEALQEKINAGVGETYEADRVGTIMGEGELHSAADEEILGKMMDAFRTFVRLRRESDGAVVPQASI